MAEFFDKVLVGFNKGVTSVKEGSKVMVEKAKINTSIRENETKKNQIIAQIGAMVYDLQSKGLINIEQIGDIYNAAAECDKNIEALKQQLAELETAETAANAAPAEAVPAAVICKNCGGENKNGARFCVKCGTPLA